MELAAAGPKVRRRDSQARARQYLYLHSILAACGAIGIAGAGVIVIAGVAVIARSSPSPALSGGETAATLEGAGHKSGKSRYKPRPRRPRRVHLSTVGRRLSKVLPVFRLQLHQTRHSDRGTERVGVSLPAARVPPTPTPASCAHPRRCRLPPPAQPAGLNRRE